MESLIARGLELLASGDVAGGRLLLTRAAEAGEAQASLALAGSYDAPVMGYLGIVDVPPDPAKARAWYIKAAQQGSPEAVASARADGGRLIDMSELISEARMLAALSATNEAVLRAHSSAELFQRVCEAAVDGGGLCLAAALLPDSAGVPALRGAGEPRWPSAGRGHLD